MKITRRHPSVRKYDPKNCDFEASAAFLDPYLSLATGVVAVACLQAQRGDLAAVTWLRGFHDAEILQLYADALDLDLRQVESWAADLDLAAGGRVA